MRFKFIGEHTNGRTSITLFGVTFEGDDAPDVTEQRAIDAFLAHPEFQKIDPLDHDANGKKGGVRRRKAQ